MKFPTTNMHRDAMYYANNITEDSNIIGIDYTDKFLEDMWFILKNKQFINININAQVRKGKSTLGITLAWMIVNMMIKQGLTNIPFGMRNICRTQYEASKKQRDPNLYQTVIVIDEISEMEDTGENSTTEIALRNTISDIHAGRYIHKINISPKGVQDKNSDIFLEVQAVDRELKLSHCYLYYNISKAGHEFPQILGHVNIYVGDVINNWGKIEEVFYNPVKTENDKILINEFAKKDFFVEYMVKKFEKMEFITKHGVMKERDLDYAGIYLRVIEALKPLVKLKAKYKKLLRGKVEREFMKAKMPHSIPGIIFAMERIEGVLILYEALYETKDELRNLVGKRSKGKIPKSLLDESELRFNEIKVEIAREIADSMAYYHKMASLTEHYYEVLSI